MLTVKGFKGIGAVPNGARGKKGERECAKHHHEHFGNRRSQENPSDDGTLFCITRYVARVVVATLRPAETREREHERETGRVELPSTAKRLDVGRTVLEVVNSEHQKDDAERNDE